APGLPGTLRPVGPLEGLSCQAAAQAPARAVGSGYWERWGALSPRRAAAGEPLAPGRGGGPALPRYALAWLTLRSRPRARRTHTRSRRRWKVGAWGSSALTSLASARARSSWLRARWSSPNCTLARG